MPRDGGSIPPASTHAQKAGTGGEPADSGLFALSIKGNSQPAPSTTCRTPDGKIPVPDGIHSLKTHEVDSRPAADLSDIFNAWPTLPEAVKVGIRAMVKASGTTSTTVPDAREVAQVDAPASAG